MPHREAYLEALDIPVWVRKEHAAAADAAPSSGLRLGPGSGRFLLLCAQADDTAGRLAADIARVLGEAPVWAWPAAGEPGKGAHEAVQEHLFTTLLVFGAESARGAFGANPPETVGSARVVVVPGMAHLASDPRARRELWESLCENRCVPKV